MQDRAIRDGELAAAARQRDASVEAALYERFGARIYFLALGELGSKEDAEDVRDETILRVIQALRQDKLRSPDSLPAFVVGVALNVIREHRRQTRNLQQFDGREVEVAGGPSPEAAFLDEETGRAFREVARGLKPREREFLRLYYYEEWPKEAIARALGIKVERLRLMKSRALKRFRDAYRKRS
jgi:RNA polymerase sigma-70 factor (ECF subfamily)